jgi:hypothetical protein
LFLQTGVLFLQFLVLPTSPPVLKPNSNLAWFKTQFRSEPVLSLGLQLVFITEVILKKIDLLVAKLPLLGPYVTTFSTSFALLSTSSWF